MDTSAARGALTGARYKASLDDGRDVWLNGERVKNVAEHPAFRGTAEELARLFDLRLSNPAAREMSLARSPESGNSISRAYSLPRDADDLRGMFAAAEWWAGETLGQNPRAPDFMANVTVGLYDLRSELDAHRPGFGAHAVNYHRYASEHDLVLTHALGDPQIDRSASPVDQPDLALRVVSENDAGVVIRGAKQLATLAPFAQEVLVYLNAVTAQRDAGQFVIWFALPVSTPGLKILCREALGDREPASSHQLARRFDEQDAMLFFDDVTVPWERVFLLGDSALAARGLSRLNAWSLQTAHVRFHERLKLFASVAAMTADAIGVSGFRSIQEYLGELISYTETLRLAMTGAEASAKQTPGGLLAPSPSVALGIWSAGISTRIVEILRRIAASGLIMQPSDADLANPELRPFLEKYMRGRNIAVDAKARLMRIARELAADSFGARQELYEYLHRGDPAAASTRLYRAYDRSAVDQRLLGLISEPAPIRDRM